MVQTFQHKALEQLFASPAFDGEVNRQEMMGRHTSYRIGGPAAYFIRAHSLSTLKDLLVTCEQEGIELAIVGRGTNLLVSDEGFAGVICVLGRDFKNMTCNWGEGRITAGGAVLLSSVVQEAMSQELTGLEFAVGTPGTIGGAVRMNAGSREEWMGSVVSSVVLISAEKGIQRIPASQIAWDYRKTNIPRTAVIAECEISLKEGDPFLIQGKMEGNLARRKKTQPLNLPSCGSVFKNPEGYSVGKMVDELGLKGRSCGGAQISEVHANFIVNTGGATAADVCTLMKLIQTEVEKAYGITLTPEVKFLGFK